MLSLGIGQGLLWLGAALFLFIYFFVREVLRGKVYGLSSRRNSIDRGHDVSIVQGIDFFPNVAIMPLKRDRHVFI